MTENENFEKNYSLKIKYDEKNKEKIIEILASHELRAEELNLKYAENWLVVKQQISDDKISELEKKLKEFNEGIIVEKIKQYSLDEELKP